MSGWLEQNPLERMELLETLTNDGGMPIVGQYSFKDNTLQVATRRSRETYGQPFEWERVYSVSSTAQTQAEAVQITLVHELGHHVHSWLGKLDRAQFDSTMGAVRFRAGTTYAKTNNLEYFAESFALYTFYSTELLIKDPDRYGMIVTALKRLELEVKQK